jgi:hypothetical protein
MNFQRYVIIFFVVLLLIIMIFLGVTMSNNKATNIPWPPIVSSCPDYWTDTPDEPPPETISTYVQTCKSSDGNECNWTNTTTGISCNKEDGDPNCSSQGCSCTSELTEIPNPDYTKYIPIPHVPGSRCIGTMGQNTGNYPFNAINSKCIDKSLTHCDPETCDNCKTATVDFTSTGLNYTGANGDCQKQGWAINSGKISWDGITYGYGENNPCWTP